MPLAADYPFLEIVGTIAVFFALAVWLWLLIVILTDVFRRHDASGWAKAGWTLLVLVLPFVGVLTYIVAHGKGMAERREREAERRWARFDQHARGVAEREGRLGEDAQRARSASGPDEVEYAKVESQQL